LGLALGLAEVLVFDTVEVLVDVTEVLGVELLVDVLGFDAVDMLDILVFELLVDVLGFDVVDVLEVLGFGIVEILICISEVVVVVLDIVVVVDVVDCIFIIKGIYTFRLDFKSEAKGIPYRLYTIHNEYI